jgi:hypothetical protein
MIRKLVQMSGMALMAVLLFASSGVAQTFDVAGGYAWLREEDLTVPNGWFGAAGVNLNDSFAVFGQLSQHSKTLNVSGIDVDTKLTIWGGGPRLTGNQRSSVTYFAQLLLGGASSKASVSGVSGQDFKDSNFALQPAAGVDVKAGGTVGVRFQGGLTLIKAEPEWQREWVILVGIVFRGG